MGRSKAGISRAAFGSGEAADALTLVSWMNVCETSGDSVTAFLKCGRTGGEVSVGAKLESTRVPGVALCGSHQ